MKEPSAIWGMQQIRFDKNISLTQNIILSQGREALKAVIRRIKDLDTLAMSGPLTNAGINDQTHSIISDLCYQAGLASTILFNKAKKGFKESDTSFQLREQRVKYVDSFCDDQGVTVKTLKDREVRNALTHIDERLADILTEKEGVGWFVDVVIDPNGWETKDDLEIKFCRCYDLVNKKILHLGYELDVRKLLDECLAVLAVVFRVDGRKYYNQSGDDNSE
jgi:hypothetical protein